MQVVYLMQVQAVCSVQVQAVFSMNIQVVCFVQITTRQINLLSNRGKIVIVVGTIFKLLQHYFDQLCAIASKLLCAIASNLVNAM